MSLVEQIGVGAGAHENQKFGLGAVVDFVGEQEIAADVTFAMASPFPLEGMIQPFRAEGRVVGDEVEHRLFEAMHVVASRTRQALPILQKGLGVVAGPRRAGALTLRGLFQGR